ncbi:MAG TPA: hypothetical protein VJP58_06250 [Candidatus Nitrosocosmicus sp.]|nr:hypothetical protein [Candidatus Nitrosocosmicus sp.]
MILVSYIMQLDLFEIDRVIDDMARGYAAPCATTWFKVTNNKNPTKEEYRKKVVEFMKHFEYVLANLYPTNTQTEYLRDYVKGGLRKAIHSINSGNNKEVERRYTYYTDYC